MATRTLIVSGTIHGFNPCGTACPVDSLAGRRSEQDQDLKRLIADKCLRVILRQMRKQGDVRRVKSSRLSTKTGAGSPPTGSPSRPPRSASSLSGSFCSLAEPRRVLTKPCCKGATPCCALTKPRCKGATPHCGCRRVVRQAARLFFPIHRWQPVLHVCPPNVKPPPTA